MFTRKQLIKVICLFYKPDSQVKCSQVHRLHVFIFYPSKKGFDWDTWLKVICFPPLSIGSDHHQPLHTKLLTVTRSNGPHRHLQRKSLISAKEHTNGTESNVQISLQRWDTPYFITTLICCRRFIHLWGHFPLPSSLSTALRNLLELEALQLRNDGLEQ